MNAGGVGQPGGCEGERQHGTVHLPYPGPHSHALSYSGYTVLCLGRAQVATGSLSVVLQGLGLALDVGNHRVAPGIWCGMLFIAAGVVGVLCGQRNTNDWIAANLAISVTAALFTMGPLINCSLADGNFGARLLCWLMMAVATAELVSALSSAAVCASVWWRKVLKPSNAQMVAAAPQQRAGASADKFQVVYVPPAESDTSSSTQPSSLYVHHPQSLTVNTGLGAGTTPTCVVIPPTPSPPPGTDDESPITERYHSRA